MSDAALAPYGDRVAERLAELTGALRALGTRVGVGELLAAHRALGAVDCGSREDARLALRTVLCSQRVDLVRFDARLPAGVRRRPAAGPRHRHCPSWARSSGRRCPSAGFADAGGHVAERDAEPVPAAWSDVELTMEKDFARYTEAEMAAARELIAQLARRHPTRISRRTRPSRRRGHTPDLRHTVHASLRTGGRTAAPALAGAHPPPPPGGARLRRVGLDGPVRADAAAVHARLRRRAATGRGVRVRDPPDPDHQRAGRPRPRPGARPRGRGGDRLLRRNADRRRPRRAQPRPRPPARPRRRGGDPVGRLGPRRSRAARAGDGPPAARGAPAGVAQPAGRPPRLRAADPRDARRGPSHRPAAGRQLARLAGAAGCRSWRRCDRGCRPGLDVAELAWSRA